MICAHPRVGKVKEVEMALEKWPWAFICPDKFTDSI